MVRAAQSSSGEKEEGDEEDEGEVDLMPRADISAKFSEELLAELSDKNWKVRRDALAQDCAKNVCVIGQNSK